MKTILKNNWLPLALCAAIIIIYLLAPMPAHSQPVPQEITNLTIYPVPLPTVKHLNLDPATVQSQFNAWAVVFAGIGAVLWHVVLAVWPSLKRAYPYVVANRGIVVIVGKFFYQRAIVEPTAREQTILQAKAGALGDILDKKIEAAQPKDT